MTEPIQSKKKKKKAQIHAVNKHGHAIRTIYAIFQLPPL
jgi:hypothetical protein